MNLIVNYYISSRVRNLSSLLMMNQIDLVEYRGYSLISTDQFHWVEYIESKVEMKQEKESSSPLDEH